MRGDFGGDMRPPRLSGSVRRRLAVAKIVYISSKPFNPVLPVMRRLFLRAPRMLRPSVFVLSVALTWLVVGVVVVFVARLMGEHRTLDL